MTSDYTMWIYLILRSTIGDKLVPSFAVAADDKRKGSNLKNIQIKKEANIINKQIYIKTYTFPPLSLTPPYPPSNCLPYCHLLIFYAAAFYSATAAATDSSAVTMVFPHPPPPTLSSPSHILHDLFMKERIKR